MPMAGEILDKIPDRRVLAPSVDTERREGMDNRGVSPQRRHRLRILHDPGHEHARYPLASENFTWRRSTSRSRWASPMVTA